MSETSLEALEKVETISNGLCLIGFQFVDAPVGPNEPNGEFSQSKTIKIPDETVHVHIGITGVRLEFGKKAPPLDPRLCSGFIFQSVIESLGGGYLTFKVKVHFVGDPPLDPWHGDFWATIMCFGPCGKDA
jgi:hypothetical protein